MKYEIVEVGEGVSSQLEQLGTKEKFWFIDQSSKRTLFKAERLASGEHWSEKACCEICRLLELPHAEYELARFQNKAGVVSPSFVPHGGRLILANELIVRTDDNYDHTVRYRASGHTVSKAIAVLSLNAVKLPLNWQPPLQLSKPSEVFVGYLMLDALVSNQDRHHENWGMIINTDSSITMAPTFDHASSLGRNETDERRHAMLNTNDSGRTVQAYVKKAKSALYRNDSDSSPLSTIDAFLEAARFRPAAARYWVQKLTSIPVQNFRTVLDRLPDSEISHSARDFAYKMIESNRERIVNSITQLQQSQDS